MNVHGQAGGCHGLRVVGWLGLEGIFGIISFQHLAPGLGAAAPGLSPHKSPGLSPPLFPGPTLAAVEGQKFLPRAENRTSLSPKANKPQGEPGMRESSHQ